jgi:hypothetical protein
MLNWHLEAEILLGNIFYCSPHSEALDIKKTNNKSKGIRKNILFRSFIADVRVHVNRLTKSKVMPKAPPPPSGGGGGNFRYSDDKLCRP